MVGGVQGSRVIPGNLDIGAGGINALLAALANATDLTARYVCVAVYADWTSGLSRRGETSGTMVREPRGADGFGYDPLFLVPSLGKTFAELGVGTKSDLSHRAQAMKAIEPRLRAYLDQL